MKAPTLVAIFALVVLSALATVLLTGADVDAGGEDATALQVQGDSEAEFGSSSTETGDDLEASGAGEDGPPEDSDGDGAEETGREEAQPGEGYRVRVVRGDTKQTLAGATVASLDYERYKAVITDLKSHEKRLASIVERFGVRHRANSLGVGPVVVPVAPDKTKASRRNGNSLSNFVRIRSSTQWIGIAAWTDGFFGCKWVKVSSLKKKKPIDFEVFEDKTLVVRVLDQNSKPVPDFPLRFYRLRKKKSANRDSLYPTGPDGRVVLEHWQTMHRSKAQRWAIYPEVVYREVSPITFSTEELQPEYTMRVAATGSMEFVVRTREGKIVRESGSLELRSTQAWPAIETSRVSPPRLKVSLEDGVAKFPRVGLGVRFKTSVRIGRNFRDSGSFEFPGPMRAGERLRHELRLGKPGVSLSGTLALASQKAIPTGHALTIRSVSPAGKAQVETVKVTDAARFSVFLPFVKTGVHRFVFSALIDKARHEHVKDITIAGAGASIDLGEIVLAEPQAIASGVVIGAEGKPVRRARVSLLEAIRQKNGSDKLVATHVPSVSTGADGTFTLTGHSMRGRFRLRVSASGYKRIDRPLRIGESEIEVRLAQLGTLKLEAMFTKGITKRVRFRARHSKNRSSHSTRVRVASKGPTRFSIRSMTPGSYDLTLEIDEWAAPIWSRRGYVVRAGVQELGEALDFREVLRRYTFVGSTSGGSFKGSQRASLLVDVPQIGKAATSKSYSLTRKGVSIICPHANVKWRAHMPGAAVVEGSASPGKTQLVFVQNKPIRFAVPGLSAKVKRIEGAWATLKFSRVGPSAAVPNSKDSARTRFQRGIRVRSLRVSDDSVNVAFGEPSASYRVELAIWCRAKRTSRIDLPGSNVVNLGLLSGYRFNSYRPNLTAKPIGLGEIRPAELASTPVHRFELADAVIDRALAELREKLDPKKK